MNARIAALEATVARLTAPVEEWETAGVFEWFAIGGGTKEAAIDALTDFLKRRMKG